MNNVLFTKVKFFRNLKDYKFQPKLTKQAREEINDKVKSVVANKMSYLILNNADNEMLQYLKSNRLFPVNSNSLFVSIKDNTVIQMFTGEHVNILSTGAGYDKKVVYTARDWAKNISDKISLSYSDEYGYLMSDISNIGTGMKIECDISLQAINSLHKIDQVKQNMKKLGYILKSTSNPNIFTLSTGVNLGHSEQEIVDDFEKIVIKLNDLEIESAKLLDVGSHDIMLDKANRSIAILNAAHLMTYEELVEIIQNIRMGLNIGLIELAEKKLRALERLIFNKNDDFVSQSELIDLASQVKNILKGE